MMQEHPTEQHSMGWHKYLIYFGLWVSMLLCAGEMVLWLSGKAFGPSIYSLHPSLRTIEFIIGALYLVLIILLIVTQRKLLNMEANGPTYLRNAHIFMLVHSFASCWLASSVSGRSLSVTYTGSFSFILTFIGIVGWIVNAVYYQTRKDEFNY